jgi:hypothetical protein
MRSVIPFLGALLALAAFSAALEASTLDALVLVSEHSGQYDYGIQLAPNHGLTFNLNDQLLLTGLAGVTGAAVLSGLSVCFSVVTTTPVSAAISNPGPCPVFDPVPTGVLIPALRVFSSVTTTGAVHYKLETGSEGTISGEVRGPVVVPEGGGTMLAAMGLFLIAAFRGLRRHART